MKRINLLIVEGVLIILLVLFSGFLAYQNQKLTKEIDSLSRPLPSLTPTPAPSPTPMPSLLPSPGATKTPTATTIPKGLY